MLFLFLLSYVLLVVCLVLPSIFIYRSPRTFGWRKTIWVLAAPLSAIVIGLLPGVGLVLAKKYGGYEQTWQSVVSGPVATAFGLTHIAMFLLPWIVYIIFEVKHAETYS